MLWGLIFTALGYLAGSVLFARVFGAAFHVDVTQAGPDGNPGTFNAYAGGGFWCGTLTLLGDLLKGFAPVFLYAHVVCGGLPGWWLAPVLAAPVAGHILPIFYNWQGGKGIAVSFGCLLGLLPRATPLLILAAVFVFFSVVVRIDPHAARTLWTYRVAALAAVVPLGR